MDELNLKSFKNTFIVVVEDSPVQAKKLRYLLQENGFEVAVYLNGIGFTKFISFNHASNKFSHKSVEPGFWSNLIPCPPVGKT